MARPWRIEYEGALYHDFLSRGNNQPDIFVTDDDRYLFLDRIGQMSERFDLDKNLILSHIHGENKHRQYREKSQKYSDENRRIWKIFATDSFREIYLV